jgi:hypothetical protein
MVPADIVLSPQSIEAVKSDTGDRLLAAVKVATLPLNRLPATAEIAFAVTDTATWPVPLRPMLCVA